MTAWTIPCRVTSALSPSKANCPNCLSKQLCTSLRRTGAYYAAKLKFSHDFALKVGGAYYTSVFEFLRVISVFSILCNHYKSNLFSESDKHALYCCIFQSMKQLLEIYLIEFKRWDTVTTMHDNDNWHGICAYDYYSQFLYLYKTIRRRRIEENWNIFSLNECMRCQQNPPILG